MDSSRALSTITDEETRFLVASHCAVAESVGVSRAKISAHLNRVTVAGQDSLFTDGVSAALAGGDWRPTIVDSTAAVRPGAVPILAIELCTSSPLVEAATLTDSRALRRMDAVLDYLETEYNCYDLQYGFTERFTQIHPGSQPWAGEGTIQMLRHAANVMMFVHPLVGAAADVGLNLIHTDGAPLAPGDAPVNEQAYARLLLICDLTDDEDLQRKIRAAVADAVRADVGSALASLTGSPTTRGTAPGRTQLDVLARVVKAFDLQLDEQGQPPRPPELTGTTVLDAQQILRLLGVDYEVKDAQPNSDRWVVNPENWVVVSQNLDTTRRRPQVTLRAVKAAERTSSR